MEVQKEMFLAQMDLLRKATPEIRAEFEERFGRIDMVEHIIVAEYSGGWVETITLTEDDSVEKVRHEGGSEEAECIRHQAHDAMPGHL